MKIHSRKSLFIIFLLLVAAGQYAYAGRYPCTTVVMTSTITTDTVWGTAGSPYCIRGSVTVDNDAVLTIDPGVIVAFEGFHSIIIDEGTLSARGTDLDDGTILFTSNLDVPDGSDWNTIYFKSLSEDAVFDGDGVYESGCILEFCTIEYGTHGAYMRFSNPYVHNSLIRDCDAGFTGYDALGGGVFMHSSSGRVEGNTIIDCHSFSDGGGIYAEAKSPQIINNLVAGNASDQYGGGLRISAGGEVRGNEISGNASIDGGGIYMTSGACLFESNLITESYAASAFYIGPNISPRLFKNVISYNPTIGIFVSNGSSPQIINNFICNNQAVHGAGIRLFGSASPIITNNTLAGNTPYGIRAEITANPTIKNCILWQNGDDLANCSATYSNISNGDAGEGNFAQIPLFVAQGLCDLHLTAGSPCIGQGDNAGAPEDDIDGESRPNGDTVDVGADEYYPALSTATPSPTETPTTTNTPTVTPTATATASPTVTPTATNTPTVTPTNTPTNTPVPTSTFTPTFTPTPTPTVTPVNEHDGDADGDGIITPGDSYVALMLYLEIPVPGADPIAADFCPRPDGDGVVDPGDGYGILKEYLGISDPCG